MVDALAKETGLTRSAAEAALDAVLHIVSAQLESGEKVKLAGFGTFEVVKRAPRIGRNPAANEPIQIPTMRVPVFHPSKLLRKGVSQVE